MRLRLFAPAALVVALAIAAASATGTSQASPAKAQADALTVWLMGDAQANWPEAVANATQTFKAQHPGVDVNVQYQSWGDYKTKFEATLSAGSGPDVIEFGNTDVPKYSAAGALAPLTKGRLPELRHVAVGPDEGGQLQRQALRGAVLRRRPRRHLPHRPVQGGRDHEDAEDARRVQRRQREADGASTAAPRTRTTRPSTSRAGTGTPRCRSSTTTADRSRRRGTASGSARCTSRPRSPA